MLYRLDVLSCKFVYINNIYQMEHLLAGFMS